MPMSVYIYLHLNAHGRSLSGQLHMGGGLIECVVHYNYININALHSTYSAVNEGLG